MAAPYLCPIGLMLQAFTNAGAVLNAGKVNTYEPGTTTAVTTYTDDTLSTANANPIILSAYGRLPASVWVPSGTGVKIVLTDSSNNVLATIDNMEAINDPAWLWPQTAAETSASVTPSSYSYPPGNVLRYGADPTGTNNCMTAFQNALNISKYVTSGTSPGPWTVIVPPGTFNIASVAGGSNSNSSLTFYSMTIVQGYGKEVSKIVVTGSSSGNLFYGADQSNVVFEDLWMYGNSENSSGTMPPYGQGSAIFLNYDASLAATAQNITIRRCRFDNFGGAYWIGVFAALSTYDVEHVRIQDNDFYSYNGNAYSAVIGDLACAIGMEGSQAAQNYVRDVDISNNVVESYYIKSAVALLGGVYGAKVHHNIVKNTAAASMFAGQANGCGGYAFLAYKIHGEPGAGGDTSAFPNDQISFSENIVYANAAGYMDCGFYLASNNYVSVTGNQITNQTGTAESMIPKGAISNDGSYYTSIVGNRIDNCNRGITISGNPNGGSYSVSGNHITNIPISGSAMRVTCSAFQQWATSGTGGSSGTDYTPNDVVYSGTTSYACILKNTSMTSNQPPNSTYWVAAASTYTQPQFDTLGIVANVITGWQNSGALGIDIQGDPTGAGNTCGCKHLKIGSNTINVYRYGIYFNAAFSGNTDFAYGTIEINGNLISTNNSGGINMAAVHTPLTVIKGNTFDQGPNWSKTGWHFQVDVGSMTVGGGNLDLADNTFMDWPSGTGGCILGWFAGTGTYISSNINVANNRFLNVLAANCVSTGSANNIGYNNPNSYVTGSPGNYWQVVNPARQGTGGFGTSNQQYIVLGYTWNAGTSSWLPDARLTGT
jgi:hypothetical protein